MFKKQMSRKLGLKTHIIKLLPVLIINLVILTGCNSKDKAQGKVWKLESLKDISKLHSTILGSPVITDESGNKALSFNGQNDGLIIPENPLQGWPDFTVEVLFKPAADGPIAPRFVHFQDTTDNRGTIEIRLTPDGNWYLDSFLYNSKADSGLTLRDSTNQHPAGQWYWAALEYDGETMSHYVNGKKELEGKIAFDAMESGRISLGVRLNRVHWFKGLIKEIRFHPKALKSSELQKR